MPSQDSWLSVGTIRREAGSKVAAVEQIQETPLVIKSTSSGSEQRKVGPSELLGVGKNVVSESSSQPGSSSHVSFSMNGHMMQCAMIYLKWREINMFTWFQAKQVMVMKGKSERLHDKMTNFVSRNKAAQMHGRDGGEMSTRDLQKMVQVLPMNKWTNYPSMLILLERLMEQKISLSFSKNKMQQMNKRSEY
ncbi:unnamed protein product [Lactuca saligna]|uniref:Uncharacterized protein n=1 Tax=Lactuca saligna TaxID=75948 RepID=A0AA35ZLW0_LACSI|nr:unnamed protein product [Lactuca saligna]